MKYILIVFNLLNRLKTYFNFNGSYSELNNYLRKYEDEIVLSDDIKNDILFCLSKLEVEKENQCIAILLNPGVALEELSLENSISDLSDRQLLNYFGLVMWSVSIAEKDDLILLKYNECIWNVGWHNYAFECRGKVINKNTFEVVSYPFDKFFNLNENATTQEAVVTKKISKAKKVSLTNKLDGSTIIVSRYNDNALITTNGSFDNDHTNWAKDIFNEKYFDFINDVPAGYTFVFELIHPENRIILDYGETRDVYLIAVRDNNKLENGLFCYESIVDVANKYGLNVVEQETFTNLDDLCKKAREMTNANKEGWVIRTENGEFVDYMFKLKLEEYFILHRARAHVSMKNVYVLYIMGQLDEFMNTVDDITKQEVIDILENINICIGKVYNEVVNRAELIMTELDISRETILEPENKMKLIDAVKAVGRDKLFGAYVLSYIKGNEITRACRHMRLSKFMDLYNYFSI